MICVSVFNGTYFDAKRYSKPLKYPIKILVPDKKIKPKALPHLSENINTCFCSTAAFRRNITSQSSVPACIKVENHYM